MISDRHFSRDSFDRFGDDLCQLLLSRLSIGDRFHMRCVSRQWFALVFNTCTELSIDWATGDQLVTVFRALLANCPHISKITCTLLNSNTRELLDYCTAHVTTGQIVTFVCKITDNGDGYRRAANIESLSVFFSKFANELKVIDLRVTGDNPSVIACLRRCLDTCHTLTDLNFATELFTRRSLPFDAESQLVYPKLRKLKFHYFGEDVTLWRRFVTNCAQRMRSLNITIDQLCSLTAIGALMASLKQMRSLVVLHLTPRHLNAANVNHFRDYLAEIGSHCVSLRRLSINLVENSAQVCDQLLQCINRVFPRLQYLQFGGTFATDFTLKSETLSGLRGLTHIRLHSNQFYTFDDHFLDGIDKSLPNLMYIWLSNVGVSDDTLVQLSSLSKLQSLELITYKYPYLSQSTIDQLIESCPKLRCCKINHINYL